MKELPALLEVGESFNILPLNEFQANEQDAKKQRDQGLPIVLRGELLSEK
jgi:hypothetical protein